ncbi:MAG: glucosaminidase domain-containing protein [Minwuia sp.]|nr:glucosaminidase domain-containing protein [Minwuia sp.]
MTSGSDRQTAPWAIHVIILLAVVVPLVVMAWLVAGIEATGPKPGAIEATSRPIILAQPKLIRPRTVSALASRFESVGYDLESVRGNEIPPAFVLVRLPSDWQREMPSDVRKSLFFRSILPLVMQVNGEIAMERDRLLALRDNARLPDRDRDWLRRTAESYRALDAKTGEIDWDTLLQRVDLIPPSLALAQAALESGWGRSRFAREGNALFGQWTWTKGDGIVPADRAAGKTHSVKRFRSLLASVRGYMKNLNRAGPYGRMRVARTKLANQGKPFTGRELAGYLDKYSEEGQAYVKKVRAMISVNQLGPLDQLINGR